MIIENSEALKSWLRTSLGNICDADPAALAKYVLALVKKDKVDNDLYEFCLDQLEVFLQKETKLFVDLLFDALRTKSYLTHKPDSINLINSKNCDTTSSTIKQDSLKKRVDSEQEKNSQLSEKSTQKTSFSKGVGSDTSTVSKEINAEKHGDTTKCKKSNSIKVEKQDQEPLHNKQTENGHLFSHSYSSSSSSSTPREKMDEQAKCVAWKEKKPREELQKPYTNSDYKPKEVAVFKSSSYLNSNTLAKNSKRCLDYDEKGYCMRGDLCQFDHGSDPVVVEDVSILNFGVSIANVTSSDSVVNTLAPNPLEQNVSDSSKMSPSSPPPLPPPPPPLPPLPPSDPFSTSSNTFLKSSPYIPEAYNPEAPGMNITPQNHTPFWGPSNTILIPPPPLPKSSSSGMPNIQLHHHNAKPYRSRELIGVPTVEVTSSTGTNMSDLQSSVITSGIKRKNFDFGRLGPKPKRQNFETRCTLEVRKIPRQLNHISSLNTHFSKFGKVTNIQVCYEKDPEAALIQFRNHSEATLAYKSTEPVLNNRFIKVFWHSTFNDKIFEVKSEESTQPTTSFTGRRNDVLTSNFFMVKREKENAFNKVIQDRSVTYSTRGNIRRTVFNPSVMKKPDIGPPVASLRTEKKDLKGFNKRLELHKKKQEFLESQIKNQKIILDQLGKAKNEKYKVYLKQTIQDLANKVTALEADVKKSSEELITCLKSFNAQASTKCQAEKELLDSEMDLYNKQRAKVNELRQKAKSLGLLPASTPFLDVGLKRTHQERRPKMPFVKHASNALKVDNRPRTLIVSSSQDKVTLQKHFQQFGNIEKVDEKTYKAGTIICFYSRKGAEMALRNGKQLENENLVISWFQEGQHIAAASNEEENVDKRNNDSLLLLDEDEDEEEDSEARSWRR